MTDLTRLRVSRTKHGAYKISTLLKKYAAARVLDRVSNNTVGVHIDRAQAKKHLCISPDGTVPSFWTIAKQLGSEAVDGLVLVSLIFSHHRLISAMRAGRSNRPYLGMIKSSSRPPEKAYSAFARDLEMLGFSVEHSISGRFVKYDLHRLFEIRGLPALVRGVLEFKLREAGWGGANSLLDEAVLHGFHEVFAVSEERFKDWLEGASVIEVALSGDKEGDASFFFNAEDNFKGQSFQFIPGQKLKKTGSVSVNLKARSGSATLLHNSIQNCLAERLVTRHGAENVRIEQPIGDGRSIDAIVRVAKQFILYEIKTERSVRGCVRQALPQLLEYAYWNDDVGVRALVIVGLSRVTRESETYLTLLRSKFNIPIYYEPAETAGFELPT